MLRLLVLGTCATMLAAQAPESAIQAMKKEATEKESEVQATLKELVDGIGPRLTSSTNLTRACEWARDKFKGFGIADARIEKWGEWPVGFDRGAMKGRVTVPEAMTLEFTTASWTPGTNGPAEGPVLAAPASLEELEKVGATLRGAWMLGDVPGLKREERSAALSKTGILGTISGGRGDLVITGGNQNVTWDKLPQEVRITVNGSQFKKLKEWVDGGTKVRAEFDLPQKFVQGPIALYNVIAEIPGTEKPDELVIVGGHIDSWDGARGTTDNGTGTATTIEAARLLMSAGAKPRRTIRFMLWSGEEQGLLGSRAYMEQHADENDRISAVLVHDGGTNYVSGISATAAMMPIFTKVFDPLTKLSEELKFTIREVKALPMGIGSDHDSYVQKGIPGFFWSQAGKANYTHTHHTQYDTFDAAIPEYQRHTSLVVAVGALAIANLPEKLPREGLRSPTEVVRGPRRSIGVQFDSDDSLLVASVAEGSAAAKAGVRAGDTLKKVNSTDVKDRFDLRGALREAGEKAKLTVLRDGKPVELEITIAQQ